MILCDGNIWIALALSGHVHHRAATAWLETINDPASILFCRATHQTLLRLLTNAAVLVPYGNPPLTNEQAWLAYEALLEDERITFVEREPTKLESVWGRLARRDMSSPKLWMDAYLAAFAMGFGYTLATTDGAFTQFEGLDLRLISLSQ